MVQREQRRNESGLEKQEGAEQEEPGRELGVVGRGDREPVVEGRTEANQKHSSAQEALCWPHFTERENEAPGEGRLKSHSRPCEASLKPGRGLRRQPSPGHSRPCELQQQELGILRMPSWPRDQVQRGGLGHHPTSPSLFTPLPEALPLSSYRDLAEGHSSCLRGLSLCAVLRLAAGLEPSTGLVEEGCLSPEATESCFHDSDEGDSPSSWATHLASVFQV